jgi:hypothetical protein
MPQNTDTEKKENGRPSRTPVRHFQYYDTWKKEMLVCACDWSGTFEQGAIEYYNELMDCECPKCFTMLATVTYPSADDIRAHEPPGSFLSVSVDVAQARREEFQKHGLHTPGQLPEIEGGEFTLEWDITQTAAGEQWTVIRKGDQEIFREPAFWEGAWRYREVAVILIAKYRSRLLDLQPTPQSLLYLLGDKADERLLIKAFRKERFPRPQL